MTEDNHRTRISSGSKKYCTQFFNTLRKIFSPLSPAITASGLIKAILVIMLSLDVLHVNSDIYQILRIFADAPLYFLPILLAYSSALCFKCNVPLAVSIGGILLHPTFINMLERGSFNFLSKNISSYDYSFSVFPLIISVYFLSRIENLLDRITIRTLRFFLKPLLSLIITGGLAVSFFGPVGLLFSEILASITETLNFALPWLAPAIVGAFSPIFVLTGVHYFLIPIGINNIIEIGYDSFVGPGILASNIALSGAAFAYCVNSKGIRRNLSFSSALTAFLGISEPSVYNSDSGSEAIFPVIFSGGVAGFFMGISGVKRYTTAVPGIFALPGYIGDGDTDNLLSVILSLIIAFFTSFAGTLFLSKENEVANVKLFKRKTESAVINLASPIDGEVIPLSNVPDQTFSECILGQGAAIIPFGNVLYASDEGNVISVAETKHAVMLKYNSGVEVLMHIGIDTVELNGEGYTVYVNPGDKISKGDKLIEFDSDEIKRKKYSIITPIIITNSDEFSSISCHVGKIKLGESIIEIKK